MKIRFVLTPILLVLIPVMSFAQYIVKGKVTDQQQVAIPFALVYVKGTDIGTCANENGEYSLKLGTGQYEIAAQAIGYQLRTSKVNIIEDNTLNFQLPSQTFNLKEVSISSKSEDPAYRIMRQAIKKRAEFERKIKTLQTDIYLKSVIKVDSVSDFIQRLAKNSDDSLELGILYLGEQEMHYIENNKGFKHTNVKSVRVSGDKKNYGLSNPPPLISFYEQNVSIFGDLHPRGFYSPLHNQAFNFYKFKLIGDYQENNKVIYRILMTPKRANEPCFNGIIEIVDDIWSVHGVDLYLTKQNAINFVDSIHIVHNNINPTDNYWYTKNQIIHVGFNIFGIKAKANFTSVYNNTNFNQPIPDSILKSKFKSIYEDDAIKLDSTYWSQQRPYNLTDEEQVNVAKGDSTLAAKGDSVEVKKVNNTFRVGNFITNGYRYATKDRKNYWDVNGLIGMVTFNTIEGLAIAPEFNYSRFIDSQSRLYARFTPRYGFASERFLPEGRLLYHRDNAIQSDKFFQIQIEGGQHLYQYDQNKPVNVLYNLATSLFDRYNPLRLYEKTWAGVTFKQGLGSGFEYGLHARYEDRQHIDNHTNYAFVDESPTRRYMPNEIPQYNSIHPHEALIVSANVLYQFGVSYIKLPKRIVRSLDSDAPSIYANFEMGLPNILNSSVDYRKLLLGIEGRIGMRKIGRINYVFSTQLMSADKAFIPDFIHFKGNEYILVNSYNTTFQAMPFYTYSAPYAWANQLHLRYHLLGFLTNKIPGFNKLNWHLVVKSNLMYAQSPDAYYGEIGIGLENIGWSLVRFLNVDYYWGYGKMPHVQQNSNTQALRIGLKLSELMR